MKTNITEARFERADGQCRVSKVHEEAYQEYLIYDDTRRTLRDEVDWLPTEEYEKRLSHATKHAYVTGELTAWLSQLDQQTISTRKLAEKIAALKKQGRKDNWDPWA